MDDVLDCVRFSAEIDGKTWHIVVSRNFADEVIGSAPSYSSAFVKWVAMSLPELTEAARTKIRRDRLGGDTVILQGHDRVRRSNVVRFDDWRRKRSTDSEAADRN